MVIKKLRPHLCNWNDHKPEQVCPKVRLLVAESTSDANLGGYRSNAGENKV